jgi:3-phosphoshikimate 1-carboxyvinyltransferase
MLALFGAPCQILDGAVAVTGGAPLRAARIAVPGDPSSAAFLAAAAVLTPGSALTVEGVMANTLRTEFFAVLRRMGADVAWGDSAGGGADAPADLAVRSSVLRGVRVEEASIPAMIDEVPILAVCAASAHGLTRIEGLAELRVKESDRLDAVADMLRGAGVVCETGEDWIEIEGRGPGGVAGGGLVETRHDHRIAMSGLVLGLAAQRPVFIDDETMIATSYPEFFDHMAAIGAEIARA